MAGGQAQGEAMAAGERGGVIAGEEARVIECCWRLHEYCIVYHYLVFWLFAHVVISLSQTNGSRAQTEKPTGRLSCMTREQ